MKKILSLVLGVILLIPTLSFAQVATSTDTSTKSQLIAALYAELQVLENEIQQILAAQQTIQTQQQTILQEQQNMTPSIDTNTGSSVEGMSDATTSQAQLLTPYKLSQLGQYQIASFILQETDVNGNYIELPDIQISATLNGQAFDSQKTTSPDYPYASMNFKVPGAQTNLWAVGYNPILKDIGTYVFTFTSGELSTSTTIEIQ